MALTEMTMPVVKSGRDDTNVNGFYDVVFDTPFSDITYSIQLTPRISCIVNFANRAVTGFRVKAKDTSGASIPGVSVAWTATNIP